MADLADVLSALTEGLGAALYPNGFDGPSLVGVPVFIFPGWPDTAALDADLLAGAVQVSIFPRPGMSRVERRRLDGWEPLPSVAPTMTAAVVLNTAAFAGAGSPGQIAALIEGNGRSWTVPATGTPGEVVSSLGAAAGLVRSVVMDGDAITLPGAVGLRARVVAGASEGVTLRRQAQGLQITVWAPTPQLREAVGAALDEWMALTPWLALPQGEAARLSYDGLTDNDDGRQSRLHRRDLMVTADYPTTARRGLPSVAVIETDLTSASDPAVASLAVRLT